jgi:hypothetical protein
VASQKATLDELYAIQQLQEMDRARRAEQMLAAARAPAGLDKRGLRREAAPPRYSFSPTINAGIPDYDKMAATFQTKLTSVRARRVSTVPKPFNFRSDKLPSAKGKVKLDIEMDDMQLPEQRWPFMASRTKPARHPHGPKAQAYIALSEAATAPEPQTTHATEIRAAAVRRRQRDRLVETQKQAYTVKCRKGHAHRLQPSVAATTLRNDVTEHRREARARIQRERSAVDRALELQYQAELALMNDRVERRPLLAEQAIIV